MENLNTFLAVFAFVFFAELADKTQLLVFFLSSRYKWKSTFFGVLFSSLVLMAIAVFPAELVKKIIPIFYLKLVSGILFLIFGIIALLEKSDSEGSGIKVKTFKLPALLLVFTTFFIAEMGDRTQIAALSLALKYKNPIYVWLGSFLGLFLANVPVIFGGHYIMKKIKPKLLKLIGAILFLAFGLFILIDTIFLK